MKCIKLILASLMALIAFQASSQQIVESTEKPFRQDAVRENSQILVPKINLESDTEVCMIVSGGFDWSLMKINIRIYSTHVVEESCNLKAFYALTIASIKAQLKGIQSSTSVTLRGGVHRYVVDENLSPIDDEFYMIGNLKFSPVGVVNISLWDYLKSGKSIESLLTRTYKPLSITSNDYLIWNIGTTAHQLIDPEGNKYLMVSYTKVIYEDLTRSSLFELQKNLKLPTGWKFETFVLDKTITIRSSKSNGDKRNYILDEMQNFYIQYQ